MLHKWILFLTLALASLLAACTGASQPQAAAQEPGAQAPAATQPAAATLPALTATPEPVVGGIKGAVHDAGTGKALAGSFIIIKSVDGAVRKDTLSDVEGNYQIDLPKGSYNLTASLAGYQTNTSPTPIDTSGTAYTTVPINLTPSGESKATLAPAAGSAKCTGAEYKGFCWYLGDTGLSCEAVCSTRGGYSEGTQSFAGSGGSLDNCANVIVALGDGKLAAAVFNTPDSYVWETSSGGAGCYTLPNPSSPGVLQAYWDKDSTTAQAVVDKPGFQRLCACQK
jgi:hypothetical protein